MTTILRWRQAMFSAIVLGISLTGGQRAQAEPRTVTIEGRFGKAEVDVVHPSLVQLHLRGPEGLDNRSLLAANGVRPWASGGYANAGTLDSISGANRPNKPWVSGGYTYVVGHDDRRYESRLAKPENVLVQAERGRTVLQIKGVKLTAGADQDPVATEDWTLSAPADGTQLVWKIVRKWQRDCTSAISGSPGMFFTFNAHKRANSVTTTIWYDPLRLEAGSSAMYSVKHLPWLVSENHLQKVKDRDTWTIYKLWTNWHAPADLRLEVQGGHLYRRGSFAYVGEAGAVTRDSTTQTYRKGQTEEIALKISAVDKQATGYQLAITLPDKATEASLKDFYGSVLNGGAINDQKGFDFGNESDGFYYAGGSWMRGMTLAAGIPASGRLSSHPYDAAQAFREHLAHILGTLDDQGRTHFGYNKNGMWVDDNLHTIQGVRAYLLHSGDLAFVRQSLPALERMLAYFIQHRNDKGLFNLKGDPHWGLWYYDAIDSSGVNGYYNAFFYKAANDLAEMEVAAGREEKAREYRVIAHEIKKVFNEVLWKEDAPGGPRYLDWIDVQGKEHAYFCDLCQWPPVAVGIASPEQARKIVATADARIKELEKEQGYQGSASVSMLWPLPASVRNVGPKKFGTYMNGGSFLAQTYWEIMARVQAGDHEGAARRLRLFARHASETSWAGGNGANIKGEVGGGGEPYLADMVVVPAAAVHGLLGIAPTWDRLEVTPHLPADWPRAEADILYKGRRHHIAIENGKVHIQPLEQVIDLPPMWTMDFNLRTLPGGKAVTSNVEFLEPYGHAVVLAKTASSGTYQSPPHDWAMPVRLTELTVTVDLHGGRGTVIAETSNDGFKTVSAISPIALRDGVNSYPLNLAAPARLVRLRFELVRGPDATTTPVLDGFRVTAVQEGKTPLGNR